VTDFLDEKRQEINKRLTELKPAVDEYNRLEAAASALAGVGGASAPRAAASTTTRRRPGRPRGSGRKAAGAAKKPAAAAAKKPAGRRRAGRRKGSGTRSLQALQFVTGQPGITIPELAAKMGIKQNYLYRVLPALQKEGKVAKRGKGWHPKG
jgi:hypothetical protein